MEDGTFLLSTFYFQSARRRNYLLSSIFYRLVIMHKKKSYLPHIIFYCLLALLFIFLAKTTLLKNTLSFFAPVVLVPQQLFFHISSGIGNVMQGGEVKKLQEENRALYKKIVAQKNLENEVKALRDQFATTTVTSADLLPASIIGSPGFVPSVTLPEYYIIDKGEKDGVIISQAVIVGSNIVGFIQSVTNHTARVQLISQKNTTFTAKTNGTGAVGVVTGKGNGDIVFDNVLLSDSLKVSDVVVTKGDVDINGKGVIPNLIIGKIVAIDKKPSALFQVAKVQSLVDFSHVATVFVVIPAR